MNSEPTFERGDLIRDTRDSRSGIVAGIWKDCLNRTWLSVVFGTYKMDILAIYAEKC